MTITLVSRTRNGQDAYGNDVWATSETDITGCAVWPRTSSEQVQGQDLVIDGLSVLAPADTVVQATDQVKVSGQLYEVDGEPGIWSSGLTGWAPGVQFSLRKVTG